MKSIKITLFTFILIVLFEGASAQLSGTYTIGGTTPDYATIQGAITALQTAGMSGPVTLNIRPGTYNEKLNIGTVPGTSATNTITIKSENGDSTSVIITDSSSAFTGNFTFHIFGTDYLTIRNLTIRRSGTEDNSTVFNIASNSRFLQLRNNIIETDNDLSFAVSNTLVYFPVGSSSDSSITFANNVFNNGYYGVYVLGNGNGNRMTLTQVTNNIFNNQLYCPIQVSYTSAPNIRGNRITANPTSFNFLGISLDHIVNDFKVLSNTVTGITEGDGLHFDSCVSSPGTEGLIANNFVATEGAGFVNGIYVNQCSSLNFYYNTVNVATTGNNPVFSVGSSDNSLLSVKNNIFANTGGGYTYALPANSLSNFSASDYNDLYVKSGATVFAILDTINFANFSEWQTTTSLDTHSVSGNPLFVGPNDVHVTNALVNNDAQVIAGITTDIDGQTRSNTTPDIGADEFVPFADNLGLESILSPSASSCGDSSTTISVVIHNYGSAAHTGFSIKADITGDTTLALTQVYGSNLTTNETDTVLFTQTLNTYAGMSIDMTVYISLVADLNHSNDTLSGSFHFAGHPNAPTVVSPQQVCDNNALVSATPDSGDVAAWFDQPVGGNLLFVGDTFNPVVTGDSTFYVESRAGGGAAGCMRITEISLSYDFVEIENISGGSFDATGWKVVASDDYSDINLINSFTWDLDLFSAGEIKYRSDVFGENYWGINLNWEPNVGGWAMIIDNFGNVQDFVVWDWDSTSIGALNISAGGFNNITIGSQWHGDGFVSCITADDLQRIGSEDHDNAGDIVCAAESKELQNTNLSTVFINCGIGICGSPRLPVDVTLIPGLTPVSLGNDSIISGNFSLTLDAGAGYTTYDWSTGETTQSIVVNSLGTYWVTVTGGTAGCSYTDSITFTTPVGLTNIIGADEVSFYPNPASSRLVVSGRESLLNSALIRVTDIEGRIVAVKEMKGSPGRIFLDINNLKEGIYFLQIISGDRIGTKRFTVIR